MLVLGTCECDTFYGKREFSDVTKLRILKWRDHLHYPGRQLNVITRILIKRKQDNQSKRRGCGDDRVMQAHPSKSAGNQKKQGKNRK
jgi:hypothetical protein